MNFIFLGLAKCKLHWVMWKVNEPLLTPKGFMQTLLYFNFTDVTLPDVVIGMSTGLRSSGLLQGFSANTPRM